MRTAPFPAESGRLLFLFLAFSVYCFSIDGWCDNTPEGGSGTSAAEGAEHGFPVLRDLNGRKLADGDFVQWLDAGRLHARMTYEFSAAHRIVEEAIFRQEPKLEQERWSWRELKDGGIVRQFEVEFTTGRATAEESNGKKPERWSTELHVVPGQTFAGFGFTLAIRQYRDRLIKGEKIQLQAVGFTPKPRLVGVEIAHRTLDRMVMSGRTLHGDCFVIHPEIPKIARVFVKVPDTRIWLINPPPAGFLRWEGPLAEPSDPVVRVDLLPGDPSGPAQPE